jgi:predicted O-methyltransferase YrrM
MPKLRARLSRSLSQVATMLGLRNEGFFVRYLHAETIDRAAAFYPAVAEILARHDADLEAFIAGMEGHLPRFQAFGAEPGDPPWDPRNLFPPLDGAAAYAMVRAHRPARILEIGSGLSTRYLLRAIRDMEAAGEGACRLTCIDPAPRVEVASLGVEHLPRVLETSDAAIVGTFGANDMLFVDSSHVMVQGSDVDIAFNHLFPALPPGALVHVHDVFLPHGYPRVWDRRWYSEQNALAGWIVSGFFEPVWAGHHATRRFPDRLDALLAAIRPGARRTAGSLWLRRCDPGPGPGTVPAQ